MRKIIAPVKEKIMALMLDMAKEKGWQFGCKDGVLYIDTPGGHGLRFVTMEGPEFNS